MTTMCEEIAALLVAQGPWTTDAAPGVFNIFWGGTPDTAPDDCLTIFEYPGSPPMDTMGPGAAQVIVPRIQVLSRGLVFHPDGARARAYDAYRILDAVLDTTVGDTRYHRIQPLQEPFELGRDENKRYRIAFNSEVIKAPEAP